MNQHTPDSWIESSHDPNVVLDDAGYCDVCGKHIDVDCECTEEEREDGPQGCQCPLSAENCTC